MIFEAIEYAIGSLNSELERAHTLGYHFTTEVRTFNRYPDTEIRIAILAVSNDGVYDPIHGRKSMVLVSETWREYVEESILDKMRARTNAEQNLLNNIIKVLLVGIGSPYIITPEDFDNQKVIETFHIKALTQ